MRGILAHLHRIIPRFVVLYRPIGVFFRLALLVALLEADGRVLSRQVLLESVWGYSYSEGTRTVDVHVRRVREKLPGVAPELITVKSLGCRLARPPREEAEPEAGSDQA